MTITQRVGTMCYDETPPVETPPSHTFTPEQQNTINEIVAKERRSEQTKRAAERQQLQKQIEQIQSRADISEAGRLELQSLTDQLKMQSGEYQSILEGRENQFKSQLENTEKTYKSEIQEHEAYRCRGEIERVAAQNDAFDPSIVARLLKDNTRYLKASINPETGEKLPARVAFIDEKGKEHKIEEAVAATMKQSPELFKSRMVSGTGQYNHRVDGGSASNRPIDWNTISPQEYQLLRKSGHPELRGLGPRHS